MAFGPGKYDDITSRVRAEVGITDQTGGGVLVIVLGGDRGDGFSCQADAATTLAIPDILENVSKQIRRDTLIASAPAPATSRR
jgi:hypothetical protein